ncbi:MAG TPA: hypothetical protein VGS41_04105 [Chthonomonadales bacterium]|nr:hypothetical protein [Chthonomonadales bacterium]
MLYQLSYPGSLNEAIILLPPAICKPLLHLTGRLLAFGHSGPPVASSTDRAPGAGFRIAHPQRRRLDRLLAINGMSSLPNRRLLGCAPGPFGLLLNACYWLCWRQADSRGSRNAPAPWQTGSAG